MTLDFDSGETLVTPHGRFFDTSYQNIASPHVRTEDPSLKDRLFTEEKRKVVLVVDDDVDAAIVVSNLFRRLGCVVSMALNLKEAKRKIMTVNPDLIILDWIFGPYANGAQVLEHLANERIKAGLVDDDKTLEVVTFSALPLQWINIPGSGHFEHVDHWQKPLTEHDLVTRALSLFERREVS